jgi:hypothetical protein
VVEAALNRGCRTHPNHPTETTMKLTPVLLATTLALSAAAASAHTVN